jgi:pilus assembly protein CpaC
MKSQKLIYALMIGMAGMMFLATPALGQSAKGPVTMVCEGLDAGGQIRLMMSKSRLLTTATPYKRVSVAQPEIADVNPIGPTSLLLTARKPGATQLIVWNDAEQAQVVDVSVAVDLAALNEQIAGMFPDCKITASSLNGQIVLRGRVPNLQTAEQATQVAAPFGSKVMNFLEVSGGQQVMLQVRFAEVSRAAKQELGFNAFATDGTFKLGINNGPGVDPIGGLIGSSGTINPAVTVFGAGSVGSTSFEYFIHAMRTNSLLRVLAEPNLIAISGQEASFLAGGEFPVPVPQSGSGGGTTITIEYREFGVKLGFTPVVLGDGRIRIKVTPEVSDLDFTTAVQFQGFVTPGLTKRKVTTTVELGDGQTFAIAGLLNNAINASKSVTPGLGDIPVLGALFRSVRYERKETELVVMVTPRLVDPLNPDKVPQLPGEKWRYPTESQLFWDRDLGGPVREKIEGEASAKTKNTPHFQGAFGFQPTGGVATAEGK